MAVWRQTRITATEAAAGSVMMRTMPSTLNVESLVRIYERYGRALPPVANLVLTITAAWLLAQLVWSLVPEPEAARWQLPSLQPAQTRQHETASADIDKLIGSELFGRYAAPQTGSRVEQAPETRLSLTLLGILAGSAAESRALIAKDGGDEKPYAIGDDVIAGVSLHAIFPDRVILSRNGQFETLRLNKDAPSTAPAANTPVDRGPGDGSTAQLLGQIRDEILSDPTKASNYLRVQPANVNGQLRGYRIYPGREREAFQQLGLRPGDLVTAVNGVQLDDNQKALQLLGDLSQANAITLTIERGGQVQTLNLSLN